MNTPEEEVLENLTNLAGEETITDDEGLDDSGQPKPKPGPKEKPPQIDE